MAVRRLSAPSIANPLAATATDPVEFRSHVLTLPAVAAGLRVDVALARALPQYSRALLQGWIESGAVLVECRSRRA